MCGRGKPRKQPTIKEPEISRLGYEPPRVIYLANSNAFANQYTKGAHVFIEVISIIIPKKKSDFRNMLIDDLSAPVTRRLSREPWRIGVTWGSLKTEFRAESARDPVLQRPSQGGMQSIRSRVFTSICKNMYFRERIIETLACVYSLKSHYTKHFSFA